MANNSDNFLSLNTPSVERLQDDDDCYGYDYNRLVDALNGLRTGVVSLIDPTITAVNQTILTTVRPYDFSVDATYPAYIDFVLPIGFKAVTAKISWKARKFRYAPTGSGSGTTDFDATGSSGHSHNHSHSHTHTLHVGTTVGAANASFIGAASGLGSSSPGAPFDTDSTVMNVNAATDASGESGHNHNHNHGFTGITFSYTEGTSSNIDALLMDGVDKTSSLGGPWLSDVVLLNLLSIMPVGDGKWHTIQLTAHAQGRFSIEFTLGG